MKTIEICLAPKLFDNYNIENKIVVIVDILRATTIITTMIKHGAEKIIPVKNLNEAKEYKQKGYLVVAERDGSKIDFADFGNSPFEFISDKISGKTLVYSSTNGTNTINLAKKAEQVIIASFLNLSSVEKYLESQNKDVIILCSGWMGDYCTEDFLFAGALADKLVKSKKFDYNTDQVQTAIDLWQQEEHYLKSYIKKLFQYKRLIKFGFKEIVEYCFETDVTAVIPVLEDNNIIKLKL